MTCRLALCGSAGTGKTTLARRLAETLSVPYIEERFRRRVEAGLDLHDLTAAQRRALLIDDYDHAMAAADGAVHDHGGFVSDRCAVDFLAFWLLYDYPDEDADTEGFVARVAADAGRYDAIVVLPWGALPLEEDGVRSTNPWRQLHFQALFEGLIRRCVPERRLLWLPEDLTELGTREHWVLRRLGR